MRNAIVTGAAGYIGGVLCKMLFEHGGYKIVALDREHTKKVDPYVDRFIQWPFETLRFNMNEDDVVFHLAANSLLGPSATDPMTYYRNNTGATMNIIDQVREANARLIFASTAAVYSPLEQDYDRTWVPVTEPMWEGHHLEPPNNYGLSKLMTEQMLDACCKAYGMKAVSFRFFNVIGAHGKLGPSIETPHILSSLARSMKNNTPFVINGVDYDTPDKTCVRDYVDVKDICRAMIHAAESNMPSEHRAYNLGSHKGYSVKEIVAAWDKATGLNTDVVEGPRRPGDPPYLVARPNLFIDETGFKYEYSDDLDKMVESTWSYFKDEFSI